MLLITSSPFCFTLRYVPMRLRTIKLVRPSNAPQHFGRNGPDWSGAEFENYVLLLKEFSLCLQLFVPYYRVNHFNMRYSVQRYDGESLIRILKISNSRSSVWIVNTYRRHTGEDYLDGPNTRLQYGCSPYQPSNCCCTLQWFNCVRQECNRLSRE